MTLGLLLASPAHGQEPRVPPGGEPGAQAPGGMPGAADPLGLRIGESILIVPHGQYRPRLLMHGGKDFQPGNTFDAFSHRVRLGLEARFFSWLTFGIEVQDVRLWGEETNTLADYHADGFDVHQAWVEGRAPFGLSLRLGRQEINIDNQRLVGAVGWSDQGRAFDAVVLGYERPGWLQVRALYAKTGEQDAFLAVTDAAGKQSVVRGSAKDADLAGIWLRLVRSSWLRPSLIGLYDHQGVKEQHRATVGLFLDSAPHSGFAYTGEFYLQAGQTRAGGEERDILAFLGAARLSYKAPLPAAPSLTAWFELLSGDGNPNDGTVKAFDTLFATNHMYYGFMDLFIDIPTHTAGLGLMDLGGRLKVEPLPGLSALLDWHHFRLARRHSSGAINLGNELDLQLDYRVNKYLAFQAVLGAFLPRYAASFIRGGGEDAELYGYLQTDLTF